MLTSLTIRHVVLIEQLTVEFEDGLCALTGETGAGKSILLDSLGLALGARSDAGLVRKGEEGASVIAEFLLPKMHPVIDLLKEQDLEASDNLILRRTVNKDGRSKAYINDQPVSIGLLKTVGEMLVEIHGQFETQSLLNPKIHGLLLDEYADHNDLIQSLNLSWQSWQAKEKELIAVKQQLEQAKSDEEFLRSSIEDLDALDPQPGEEEKLSQLKERLMRREQILENLSASYAGLSDAESILATTYRSLEKIGDEAQEMLASMDRAAAEVNETLLSVQNLSADLEQSEYSLSEIDDRLYMMKTQARKHDCTIDDLPKKREELAQALNRIEKQDDILEELIMETQKAKQTYNEQADKAHDSRCQAAKKLDALIAKELSPLKLEKASFVTKIEKCCEQEWRADGYDKIEFTVSTNPGTQAGPLNKIASGGEMARFMLALKVILAEVGVTGSLVFDEVDSGIGGATAAAVGERLARLAKNRQILVVTHSPQVAAQANFHWIVSKDSSKEVKTNIIALAEDKRREEIARMLSGTDITDEARAAAEKLLQTRAA